RHAGERRHAGRAGHQEAEVPEADSDRPDEWKIRVGLALLPGRARLVRLGRPEHLRRVLPVHGQGPGRVVLQGLVMARRPRSEAQACFTLLELLVVMTIIGILAAIAVPALRDSPQRAREASLRGDLFTFRSVLDQYKGDKGIYPPDLDTLVKEGYIRRIPFDP